MNKDKKEEGVTAIYGIKFPFLDMKMASTYSPTMFKSIANRVFNRITRLTSNTSTNQNLQIDEFYPDYTEAQLIANLAPPTNFPISKNYGRKMNKRRINQLNNEESQKVKAAQVYDGLRIGNFYAVPRREGYEGLLWLSSPR
eukprot:1989738-Ditylum_brightwellii.AAC.1